jgi:hypothetical protein
MARPACETPGGIRGRPGSWSRLMSPGATSTLTPPGRTGNSPCLKRRVRQTAEPGHRSTGSMGKGQAARGPQSDHCAAVRHAGNQRVSGMVGGRRSAVGGRRSEWRAGHDFFPLRTLAPLAWRWRPGFDAGWHRRRTWEQFVPAGPEMQTAGPGANAPAFVGWGANCRSAANRPGWAPNAGGDKPVASGMAATRAGAPRGSHPIPRTVRLLDVEGLDHDLGR